MRVRDGIHGALIALTLFLLGAAVIAIAQEESPLVHRSISIKTLSGQGRLRSGFLKVRLRQEDWFQNPEEVSVTVTMRDSSTATNPDSLRFFTVKRLRKDGFIIRSPRFSSDTAWVFWTAVGR